MTELMRLSAIDQARLVRTGDVSAQELVEASITAIESMNPSLNAVIMPLFEDAREQAKNVDLNAPFAGVPFLLKDMMAEIAGTPITEGSRFLQGYISPRDSELVARYRRAGFIIVGKTNTPEFASKPTTEPELYGPTRNPWNTELSPGGSSGGSAAAVASGMAAAAHANDGGGSIRIPAAACGLVGLKATRGRNPHGPDYGDMGSAGLMCEHVVTRTVLDSAAILDVTAGADVGAPYYPPPPDRPFADEAKASPGKLRIAFSMTPLETTEVDAECQAAVLETAELCSSLGHQVEESSPIANTERFNEIFTTIWIATVAWAIRDWARRIGREPQPEYFERHTWKMYTIDAKRTPSDLLLAIQDMHRMAREIAPFFQKYDVLLTPTLTRVPFPLGYFDFDRNHPKQSTERMERIPRFTAVANITGQPAISLPLVWSKNNLPIGLHFIGRYADEATLIRLAAQLENANPWAHRWPDL